MQRRQTMGQTQCNEDTDCPDTQYCYETSKICVDYIRCDRYHRLETAKKLPRDSSHCGPCMKGYSSEILATGESASYCTKDTKTDSTFTFDSANMIWLFVLILFILLLVIGVVIIFIILIKKYRRCRKCKEKCTELNELKPVLDQNNSIKASAPPRECSPSIIKKGFKKESYCLPFNNNINGVDENILVNARPFVAPSWVSNANFNVDDSDNDSIDASHHHNAASQLMATNNGISNTNDCPTEQMAIQMPELTMEYQDNARNTVLTQTQPSNDNAGNAESTSPASSTNEENNRHDGIKTSNVLINQNITMNIKM